MRGRALLAGLLLLSSCGPPPTEEERVQAAALSYLQAMRDRRLDEAWDRLAETARHNWEGVRDAVLGKGPSGNRRLDSVFEAWAKEFRRSLPKPLPPDLSAGDLFLRDCRASKAVPPPDPAVDPPEITIDGDHAVVWFPKSRVRAFLHREEGRWRVEVVGSGEIAAEGRLERWGGTDGKRFVDLVRWEFTQAPEKEVPLPRVAGARGDIYTRKEGCLVLTVGEDGGVSHRTKPWTSEKTRNELARYAASRRDLSEPSTPSRVILGFRLHRDLPWGGFRDLLRTAVSPDIRFRDVFYAVFDPRAPDFPPCIATRCGIAYPRRIRCAMPQVTVELRAGPRPGEILGTLCDVLRGEPKAHSEGGIRVIVDPRLRMEDVLGAWAAMAAAVRTQLWIETGLSGGRPGKARIERGRGKPLDAVLLDGKPLGPDPRAPPPPILGEKESISLRFAFD